MNPEAQADDEALRRALAAGDSPAFAEFYDRIAHRLYGYLAWKLGSREEADDALQETFLRLVRYRRRLRGVDDLDAYAFAIARSVATRALRRRREREAPLPEALVAPAPRGGGSEEVRHALARLPPKQREVVVLKFLEGMTAREIAEITGARQPTVESRLAYALDKLRRALAPSFPERARGREKE